MEVRICKKCGRMFEQRGLGDPRFCSDCRKAEEEKKRPKFLAVENYIKEHPTANVEEVSYYCEVNVGQILMWVEEGRLGGYKP